MQPDIDDMLPFWLQFIAGKDGKWMAAGEPMLFSDLGGEGRPTRESISQCFCHNDVLKLFEDYADCQQEVLISIVQGTFGQALEKLNEKAA